MTWPAVRLGDVLRRFENWIEPQPGVLYREITVKLWGKGVVERRQVLGSQIGAGRRLLVRAGNLVLSRIDARNGALGIIPTELDGAVVSNDFPSFTTSSEQLEANFLGWMTKARWFVEACRAASEGTTNRVRLKEDRFLRIEISLPPLAEQRRTVTRIEELALRIAGAAALRLEADREARVLALNAVGSIFTMLQGVHGLSPLANFQPHVTSGPRNWAARYEPRGMRFYRAQDVGPNGETIDDTKVYISPPGGLQGHGAQVRSGDLLFVITGATVGRCALITSAHEPGYVSQHVALCRLPPDRLEPRFALWMLRGPQGQAQILGQRYGQGKPGLNLTNIRGIKVPFPPPSEQRRIVAYVDDLQAKVDALKTLQEEAAVELDALMPSILDKAFRGEL